MATGRSTQLTRQIGEHLVASELGRRDIIATPFAGNVPHFDLLASTHDGRAFPVQVKAINGPSWQFNASSFLNIKIEDEFQTVLGPREDLDRTIICVLVLLRDPGTDVVYTLQLSELQSLLLKNYKGGRRPKNPQSTHCALWPKHLVGFEGWDKLLERAHGDA
ncbi:MAG: hypothetical protein O9256_00540 [Rhizobiaceae bacterium]|nr:hypothetical protein [Rhizobiaceae bacterium]